MKNNVFNMSVLSLAITMSSTVFVAGDARWGYEEHDGSEFWDCL